MPLPLPPLTKGVQRQRGICHHGTASAQSGAGHIGVAAAAQVACRAGDGNKKDGFQLPRGSRTAQHCCMKLNSGHQEGCMQDRTWGPPGGGNECVLRQECSKSHQRQADAAGHHAQQSKHARRHHQACSSGQQAWVQGCK